MKSTILIVDDEQVNRKILSGILSDTYNILLAENGKEALSILKKGDVQIAAVISDLIMPESDGYELLRCCAESEEMRGIPVIVSTSEADTETEVSCLRLGAWDFIRKPYNADIIKFRVNNVIERSEMHALKELQYREQYDTLTGLYKKEGFVAKLQKILDENPEKNYALINFDIYKFQTFNDIFGMEEGDKLLKYIAGMIREMLTAYNVVLYCHLEADVFGICAEFDTEEKLIDMFVQIRRTLNEYKENYDILPNFGVYEIKDRFLSVSKMMDNAKLAAKESKGNYINNYSFYSEKIGNDILKEQNIVNNMKTALAEEQFVLFIQPKYELKDNMIEGGEILVRWIDPVKGMIAPGEFIPIFERNGFIMELDYYVWEHSCMLLRRWIDQGHKPFPISVNISRVSLYNPKLVEEIDGLVHKYGVPPELLQLELAESAYTTNPTAIKEAMARLQQLGFVILMDDFGSGYSSLNVLKDIAVDILKIDMKFMSKSDFPGRSENILASVIRMAKWLNMPVIAEGVEQEDQVSFLRSVGCEFVQGYYFAKPMSVEEYEQLAFSDTPFRKGGSKNEQVNIDSLWDSKSQMEILFSNMIQAVAIFEYDGEEIEIIRVNNAYYDMFGFTNLAEYRLNLLKNVDSDTLGALTQAFHEVTLTQGVADCEYLHHLPSGKNIWVNMKLKFINMIGDKTICFGLLSDITMQKKVDRELQKYRAALSNLSKTVETILIVDDIELNRAMLQSIFHDGYKVLEAVNGLDALNVLKEHHYDVDIILLDIMMPVMDGPAFLAIREDSEEIRDIPVIIITVDDSTEQQIRTLSMGANDYIIKPFIPEVVMRRVRNVLDSSKRVAKALRGYEEET